VFIRSQFSLFSRPIFFSRRYQSKPRPLQSDIVTDSTQTSPKMDALLRQSRSVCPFLKSTCPATLRSLATTARQVSPGGGTISNLQIIARRCPVMGKAMAVQSAKSGHSRLSGLLGGRRAYSTKAQIHTATTHRAYVEVEPLRHRDNGMMDRCARQR
jgi:hypothetical protein